MLKSVIRIAAATVALLCLSPQGAFAQTSVDAAEIRQVALDYIEGWYTGDAERMERAIHPELAKRIVTTNSLAQRSDLGQLGALTLVQSTRNGGLGIHRSLSAEAS